MKEEAGSKTKVSGIGGTHVSAPVAVAKRSLRGVPTDSSVMSFSRVDDFESLHRWACESLPGLPVPDPNTPLFITYQNELRDTAEKFRSIELRLKQLSYFMAPVRRLPNEILSIIIALHLNLTPDNYRRADGPSTFRFAPLAVNKKWRDVALSTASCWTMLDIQADDEHGAGLMERLNMQFDRSQTLQVDLFLRAPPRNYTPLVETHNAVGLALARSMEGRTSKLRSYADFRGYWGRISNKWAQTLTKFNLNSLECLRIHNTELFLDPSIEFPSLKYLFVDTVYGAEILEIASKCPRIETFSCESAIVMSTVSHRRAVMSTLCQMPLLRNVTVPLLTLPTLDFCENYIHNNVQSITLHSLSLVRASNAPKFRVQRKRLILSLLSEFLGCFPHATRLVLRGLETLDYGEAFRQSAPVQRLAECAIEHIEFEDDGIIHAPIAAVCGLFPKLKSICIQFWDPSFTPVESYYAMEPLNSVMEIYHLYRRYYHLQTLEQDFLDRVVEKATISSLADWLAETVQTVQVVRVTNPATCNTDMKAITAERLAYCPKLQHIIISGCFFTYTELTHLAHGLIVRELLAEPDEVFAARANGHPLEAGEAECTLTKSKPFTVSLRHCYMYKLTRSGGSFVPFPDIENAGHLEILQLAKSWAVQKLLSLD